MLVDALALLVAAHRLGSPGERFREHLWGGHPTGGAKTRAGA